jgi:PhoPQ-activated pathogenicity-related protein
MIIKVFDTWTSKKIVLCEADSNLMKKLTTRRKTLGLLIFSLGLFCDSLSASTKAQTKNTPEIVRPPLQWRQDGADFLEFEMVSQNFKGTPWRHLITMAKPHGSYPKSTALVTISGGDASELENTAAKYGMMSSSSLRTRLAYQAREGQIIAATIRQVPFQPIFGGKKEDDAIAFSLTQYFSSNDASWPLLLPMVTAVRQGLTAISSVVKARWHHHVDGFVLGGESKRSWTTWLTAAADHRVKAIVPMVFDMLNIPAQLEHQRTSWGSYSDEIGDYSEKGLPALLTTPAGIKLLRLIDPYQLRDKLVQPKLIILATNDPYWPLDSANLYYYDLPGPKYLLYLPNEIHEIKQNATVDQNRIILTLAASGILHLPKVDSEIIWSKESKLRTLSFKSSVKPNRIEIWSATSPNRDFRKAQWSLLKEETPQKEIQIPLQSSGKLFQATFIRADYTLDRFQFAVTSVMGLITPINTNP